MADFYDTLAVVYDDVFPLSSAQVAFVRGKLPPAPCRIIDLGCSTGALARTLSADRYDVWGVDLSPQMIAAAQSAPVANQSSNVTFSVADMRDAVTYARDVGALLCLGNTLVHLTDRQDLSAFLTRCQRALRPDGLMIVQIVNYDRVLNQQVHELPTLTGKLGNRLDRSYRRRADGLIDFVTRLSTPTGSVLDSEVILDPLRRSDLQQLFIGAGFHEVAFCGSYQGEEWSAETFHTICVARKVK